MYTKLSVLNSLHRPYHRPLWIIKWVCVFFAKRRTLPIHCFYSQDELVDFYFVLINWLHDNYPEDTDGIPSEDAVENVFTYFQAISNKEREKALKYILTKKDRFDVEKQIYSTYKAAGYYINLAKNKLHFLDECNSSLIWNEKKLLRCKRTSEISREDRKYYIIQILKYDGQLFLSLCMLHKEILKSNLKYEDVFFKFIQNYYPVTKFNFVHSSHHNYFDVRRHWMDLLQVTNAKGTITPLIKNLVSNDDKLESLYIDINKNIIEFRHTINKQKSYEQEKKEFLSSYKKNVLKHENLNNFVNLYDILNDMHMSYSRFSGFLSDFYELERKTMNIFLVNIVSTIDQRKRFYVRGVPVIKIKIS